MDFYSGARELVEEEVTGPCACSGTNLTASLVMVDMLYRCKVYNQLFKKNLCLPLTRGEKENSYFVAHVISLAGRPAKVPIDIHGLLPQRLNPSLFCL